MTRKNTLILALLLHQQKIKKYAMPCGNLIKQTANSLSSTKTANIVNFQKIVKLKSRNHHKFNLQLTN